VFEAFVTAHLNCASAMATAPSGNGGELNGRPERRSFKFDQTRNIGGEARAHGGGLVSLLDKSHST